MQTCHRILQTCCSSRLSCISRVNETTPLSWMSSIHRRSTDPRLIHSLITANPPKLITVAATLLRVIDRFTFLAFPSFRFSLWISPLFRTISRSCICSLDIFIPRSIFLISFLFIYLFIFIEISRNVLSRLFLISFCFVHIATIMNTLWLLDITAITMYQFDQMTIQYVYVRLNFFF